jgi:hypothetical protein
MEDFGGLAATASSRLEPLPCMTLISVQVPGHQLSQIKSKLNELQEITKKEKWFLSERGLALTKDIQHLEPIDLTQLRAKSHVVGYRSDSPHIVCGLMELAPYDIDFDDTTYNQPLSYYSPLLLRLSGEDTMHSPPVFYPRISVETLESLGRNAQNLFSTLLSLIIWTKYHELQANLLDKEVSKTRVELQSGSDLDVTSRSLSRVSALGTKVALALTELRAANRVFSRYLASLTKGSSATRSDYVVEIPVPIYHSEFVEPFDFVDIPKNGVIRSMSLIARDSLNAATESYRNIEMEITTMQRHMSDSVMLEVQDASLKASRQLGYLTAVLVIITIILALESPSIIDLLRKLIGG